MPSRNLSRQSHLSFSSKHIIHYRIFISPNKKPHTEPYRNDQLQQTKFSSVSFQFKTDERNIEDTWLKYEQKI